MRHRRPGRISSSSSIVEALFALSWILAGIGMHCLTTGAIWSMERDTGTDSEDLGCHVLGDIRPVVEQEEHHAAAQVKREPAPGPDCALSGPLGEPIPLRQQIEFLEFP